MDGEKCQLCNKTMMSNATTCRRAARRLSKHDQNDRRIFIARHCRYCQQGVWVVATVGITNKRSERRHKMEQEQRIIEQEERDTVIASIVDDARFYAIDPSFHHPWLERTYTQKIANDIINAAYQSLKEIKQ